MVFRSSLLEDFCDQCIVIFGQNMVKEQNSFSFDNAGKGYAPSIYQNGDFIIIFK